MKYESNINKNNFIIEDLRVSDYESINYFLKTRNEIDTFIINNCNVNLEDINYLINQTSIKTIVLNNCNISYENNNLIPIDSLKINNANCTNYEFLLKFVHLKQLEITNLDNIFNCYYLRVLNQLECLKLGYLACIHLGGLGYLKKLNTLYVNRVPIESFDFLSKIENLQKVFLSNDYKYVKVPNNLSAIFYENDES